MPSPVPGMDPYLEHPDLLPGVHHCLIVAIANLLSPQLRPKYTVWLEVRTHETTDELFAAMDVPDLSVSQVAVATPPLMLFCDSIRTYFRQGLHGCKVRRTHLTNLLSPNLNTFIAAAAG